MRAESTFEGFFDHSRDEAAISRSSADLSVDLPGLLTASISALQTHLVMVPSWTPKFLAICPMVVFLSRPKTMRRTSSRNSYG